MISYNNTDFYYLQEGEELTYEIEDNEGDSSWVILSHQNSDMLKCVADMNFADSKEMLTLTATDASGMSASVTLKADHGPNMKSALTEVSILETVKCLHLYVRSRQLPNEIMEKLLSILAGEFLHE